MVFSYWTESSAAVVPVFTTGDSYCSFFWTQAPNDVSKFGYYGIIKITSITQAVNSTLLGATFRLDRCSWWQNLVASQFAGINLNFANSKPDSIDLCSGKFSGAAWLSSLAGNTDSDPYSIRFYFPILPKDQPYGRYDYFIVRCNDTLDLQFQGIDDSTFTGSFVNRQTPGSTTKIYAKNAVAVRTTNTNSLRIKSIQIDGAYEKLVSSYLQFNLLSLKSGAGYYGLNFIDTVIVEQPIQVTSVALSGAPVVFADSTYQLTWALSNPTNVARCSLYVSLDSGKTWTPTGMSNGSATSAQWTAPHGESKNCFIKVLAIDKNGLKFPGYSQQFSIQISSSLPVTPPPTNNYSLRGSAITASAVRLAWSLSGPVDTSVDSIGIRFNVFHFPASMTDTLSARIGTYGLTDTCDTIDNLPQNSTYYFSLFVRNRAGVWSVATQNSMLLMRSSQSAGVAISLGVDTQKIDNDSLWLWTQPKLLISYGDTLDLWSGPELKPGFIQTSQGFAFRQGNTPQNTQLKVSITYRTVPLPFTAADQRIYQYNLYTGKWRLNQGAVSINTVYHTITGVCQDARMPFIVMIDTSAPTIIRLSHGKEYYSVQQPIVDTCMMSDNIENATLRLLGAAGSRELSDLSAYVTPMQEQFRYLVSIPPYVADQCSGLRAFLIADDGRNTRRINLSEKILRDNGNCDDTIAAPVEWTPLFVTAQPKTPSVAIAALSQSPYDKKSARIIQWRKQQGNVTDAGAWFEYDPGQDSLFSLAPGKLFWIKSRDSRSIHYGQAIVPSLADTMAIQLNAHGWTDFSIPFRFDIYAGDLLDATRKVAGGLTDSVGLFRWVKSGATSITEPVLLAGVGTPTDTLIGGKPYSAYNPLASPLTLRIPPDGMALSPLNPFRSLGKKSSVGSWSVRIGVACHDTVRLSPIYCASTPASGVPRWYPVSPSFSPLTIGIKNRQNNCIYGNSSSGDLSTGGCMFELYCDNTASESVPVALRIEKSTGLPPDMTVALFSTTDKVYALRDSLGFSLNPQQKSTQFLAIGNMSFLKRTFTVLVSKFSLRVVHSGHGLGIAFTLPYDTRSIELVLYDLKGRIVWNRKESGGPLRNQGLLMIAKPVATGFFLVELKATTAAEHIPQILREKVVYVR